VGKEELGMDRWNALFVQVRSQYCLRGADDQREICLIVTKG